ncbi:MAG: NADH dehydrogenase [Pirellulaceae bacterium]|nr:NADH dehydrogenase [Pirellulaceae bacterium]
MSVALVLLAAAAPLLVALLYLFPKLRGVAGAIGPWCAAPALAAAACVQPDLTIEWPWLLLGLRLGLDPTGRMFLAFTSLLYLAAGIYARSYLEQAADGRRFVVFYLVAMAGNLGLILAQDTLTFLACYATMSLAAYGLITHDRREESWRAGRIYVALVVLGEVLLFAGLALAATQAEGVAFEPMRQAMARGPWAEVGVTLLLVGFGIKLGVVPLHFWLPLAHPVAPTPASAVLSGAMIKAGLLGWLRFLPLGDVTQPEIGGSCVVVGFLTAFYGALVGLTQRNAKTVLAYSSVSQMGLVLVAIGTALGAPAAWPTVFSAVALFACHHAVAKSALFLGTGVAAVRFNTSWQRGLVVAGLLLPALALAGAPGTMGAAAKVGLKYATAAGGSAWAEASAWLLPLGSLATTLLLCRFLFLAWPRMHQQAGPARPGLWLPWLVLSASVSGLPWVVPWSNDHLVEWTRAASQVKWEAIWPMILGAILAMGVWRGRIVSARLAAWRIPAGDILVPGERLAERLLAVWNRYLVGTLAHALWLLRSWWSATTAPRFTPRFSRLSAAVENWGTMGVLATLLALALAALLWLD